MTTSREKEVCVRERERGKKEKARAQREGCAMDSGTLTSLRGVFEEEALDRVFGT